MRDDRWDWPSVLRLSLLVIAIMTGAVIRHHQEVDSQNVKFSDFWTPSQATESPTSVTP